MKRALLAAFVVCFSLTFVSESKASIQIGFDNLGVASGEFSGMFTEDGFNLDFDRMWADTSSDGTTPSTEIERRFNTDGTLTVTQIGGGNFTFSSIDWQSEYSPPTSITIQGFVGATNVASDTFTTSSSSYATFNASNLAGVNVDRLVVLADRSTSAGGSFDTLMLSSSAVPEPGTIAIWGLLGLCGTFAGYRRRK